MEKLTTTSGESLWSLTLIKFIDNRKNTYNLALSIINGNNAEKTEPTDIIFLIISNLQLVPCALQNHKLEMA